MNLSTNIYIYIYYIYIIYIYIFSISLYPYYTIDATYGSQRDLKAKILRKEQTNIKKCFISPGGALFQKKKEEKTLTRSTVLTLTYI